MMAVTIGGIRGGGGHHRGIRDGDGHHPGVIRGDGGHHRGHKGWWQSPSGA